MEKGDINLAAHTELESELSLDPIYSLVDADLDHSFFLYK